jgi:hypothetical protein
MNDLEIKLSKFILNINFENDCKLTKWLQILREPLFQDTSG